MPYPPPAPPPRPPTLPQPWYRDRGTPSTPPGRPRPRRRRSALRQRRPLIVLLVIILLLSGVGMGASALAYSSYNGYVSQLPNPATLAAMEPPLDSHVYARDGHTLLATFHDEAFRHEHVALADVATVARRATIDVEDRHFYENSSWDLPRIAKAGFDNLTHSGPLQGASTITEQLAKISFLASAERTFDRKIKELILGNEMEGNFTKDEILEMYLNRIPYGNHAIGIETAAHLYFHTTARDLDLAQASMLAGLPESPSEFNPLLHDPGVAVNPEAKDRQRAVLDSMVSVGDISEAEADAAAAENLAYHSWNESESIVAPDFVDYLRGYLNQRYGDAYIRPGGWEIYTTLDLTRQTAAQSALHDGIAAVKDKFNAHDGAMVAIDPRNGEVQALVGAWDDTDPNVGQLNMALRPVQPGSTIKLFTYSAAIASRQFTMETPILDGPITLIAGDGQPYAPQDYDRHWHGVCALKACLGNSLNVPAVKVEQATGIPYITNLEIAAGLTSLRDPKNRPGARDYSATLGGLKLGISPIDLASGAATIGAMGMHHDPTPVLRIVDTVQGRASYTHDAAAEGRRVIPENVAFVINETTSNDSNRVMEFGPKSALTLPDRRVSAKTGTTDFFTANWTVGWTPDLATSVWVGNPQPSCVKEEDRGRLPGLLASRPPLYPDQKPDDPYSPLDLAHYGLSPANDFCGHLEGATGITGAAPIWNAFMVKALAGTPPSWFTKPVDVIARGAGDDADFYLPGTEPGQPCSPAPQPGDTTPPCPAGAPAPAAPRSPSAAATPASPVPVPFPLPTAIPGLPPGIVSP